LIIHLGAAKVWIFFEKKQTKKQGTVSFEELCLSAVLPPERSGDRLILTG